MARPHAEREGRGGRPVAWQPAATPRNRTLGPARPRAIYYSGDNRLRGRPRGRERRLRTDRIHSARLGRGGCCGADGEAGFCSMLWRCAEERICGWLGCRSVVRWGWEMGFEVLIGFGEQWRMVRDSLVLVSGCFLLEL